MTILTECPRCRKKQSLKNRLCQCGEDLQKGKRSRRVRYGISYRLPGGKQRRELVGNSIEDAKAADGKRKGQKKENRLFDIRPDTKMTFNELAEWYLERESVKALASYFVIELSIRKFNAVFGDRIVSTITGADLEDYRARRIKDGIAPGTIDHEIGKTKTMIFKAFNNGMISPETLKAFRDVKKLVKGNSDAPNRVMKREESAHQSTFRRFSRQHISQE